MSLAILIARDYIWEFVLKLVIILILCCLKPLQITAQFWDDWDIFLESCMALLCCCGPWNNQIYLVFPGARPIAAFFYLDVNVHVILCTNYLALVTIDRI